MARSLDIHLSKCADKHGREVPESHRKTRARARAGTGQRSSTEEEDEGEDEASLSDQLSRSWPRRKISMSHHQRK